MTRSMPLNIFSDDDTLFVAYTNYMYVRYTHLKFQTSPDPMQIGGEIVIYDVTWENYATFILLSIIYIFFFCLDAHVKAPFI